MERNRGRDGGSGLSRRALLARAGAGATGLAGCAGAPDDGEPTTPADSTDEETTTRATRGPRDLAGVSGEWRLRPAFSDAFDGPGLDESKWNADHADWGEWSWDPENVRVADGRLRVRTRYEPHERDGRKLYYTSGLVVSRAEPLRYGFLAARVRAAPRHPGVSPAFWAWNHEPERWTEIDVVELLGKRDPREVSTNTHVFDHPNLDGGAELHEQHQWRAPWDPRDGFHVYACLWTPERLAWFVDGTRVRERVNEYWHQPLDVALSMGLRGSLRREPLGEHATTEGFPTAFEVDWVRVWERASGPAADAHPR